MHSRDRTVLSTGCLICSAKTMVTSISATLATSSSSVFMALCGAYPSAGPIQL